MINKNMLTSLTLEEIIHLGVHNQLPQLDYSDWIMIENLLKDDDTNATGLCENCDELEDELSSLDCEMAYLADEIVRLKELLQESGIDY